MKFIELIQRNRVILCSLFLIICASVVSNAWVLNENNFFVFDDYAWLYQANFSSFADMINVFPQMVYNDRPVGAAFIKLLFLTFGFNYQYHHAALLGLHLINGLLVYYIVRSAVRMITEKGAYILYTPLLSAIIFSVWPKSTMSIQWDAAIFDLLGLSLSLGVFSVYFRMIHSENKRYKIFDIIVMILLFYAALRTKEMFITLPFILILFEARVNFKKRLSLSIISIPVKIMSMIAIVYFGLITILRKGSDVVIDPSSPYYQDFGLQTLFEGLIKYIFLYFNLTGSEFAFEKFKLVGVILTCLYLLGFIVSFIFALRKKTWIFIVFIMFFMSLAPVLPLKNFQHNLYLYFPSVFVSVLFGIVLVYLISNVKSKWVVPSVASVILMLVLSTLLNPYVKSNRDYWMSVGKDNRNSFEDIKHIEKPIVGSQIYIENATNGHHIFIYGPGFVNNLIFNDPSLISNFIKDENEKIKPYVLLQYNEDGRIKEIEREN